MTPLENIFVCFVSFLIFSQFPLLFNNYYFCIEYIVQTPAILCQPHCRHQRANNCYKHYTYNNDMESSLIICWYQHLHLFTVSPPHAFVPPPSNGVTIHPFQIWFSNALLRFYRKISHTQNYMRRAKLFGRYFIV